MLSNPIMKNTILSAPLVISLCELSPQLFPSPLLMLLMLHLRRGLPRPGAQLAAAEAPAPASVSTHPAYHRTIKTSFIWYSTNVWYILFGQVFVCVCVCVCFNDVCIFCVFLSECVGKIGCNYSYYIVLV